MDHLKPVAAPEDLSWMNPPHSKKAQAAGRAAWNKLTPEERTRRAVAQASAGRKNRNLPRIKH
jgi:hypothetical protein